jgi:hypothetical protein
VLKHEHFEELCAAASIGQASGPELAELREHLGWCSLCQERYAEFLGLNAAQYATSTRNEEVTREEVIEAIDSTLFRDRFLKNAAAEGIVFSEASVGPTLPEPHVCAPNFWQWPAPLAIAAAAVFFIAASVSGFYLGSRQHRAITPIGAPSASGIGTSSQVQQSIRGLEAENQNLTAEIASLKKSLVSTSLRFSEAQSNNLASENDRVSLLEKAKEQEDAIRDLQARLDQAQGAVTNLRADYQKSESNLTSSQAAVVEDQVRIQELREKLADNSSSLARERELLAASRDIRELMAARNLHIVDVFDTDPKGKTRPAFGRIFFTEGKSLLFYAYDMPDPHLKNAGYQYRIWGKKEGPNQRAQSLGIFFSDDKVQRRWVFQYDDPKVLNEIDSVFVTLEPPNSDPTKPNGDKLMYAYLKGQANHP